MSAMKKRRRQKRRIPHKAADQPAKEVRLHSKNGAEAKQEEVSRVSFLERLPVQCNGLALGLVGLSNVVLNLHAFCFGVNGPGACIVRALAMTCLLAAVSNQTLYLAKVAKFPGSTWRTDFGNHAVVAGQMLACTMVFFTLTLCRLAPDASKLNEVLFAVNLFYVVLQPILTVRFYFLVRRDKNPISPVYFPHTIAIATIAISGGPVGVPVEILALCVWAGSILMVFLFPISLYRALHDKQNMASPGIGMLQAAPSFCFLAYSAARKAEGATAMLPDHLGHALFALSVTGVVATAYCAFQRARILRTLWFSPTFAAFTFPSASSANVALARAMTHQHPAATVYALTLCVIAVPLIAVINVAHVVRLINPTAFKTKKVD